MKVLHAAQDKDSDPKAEKVANQTEQQILDIETQIENKQNSMPEDPKAALLVKKAITDLKGRILTLKGSLPDKPEKTESNMKILEQATPKGNDSYEWFEYTSPTPTNIKSKAGRTLKFVKGTKFGLRSSSTGKHTRLIAEETGPTIVFTIDGILEGKLLNKSTKSKTRAKPVNPGNHMTEDPEADVYQENWKLLEAFVTAYVKSAYNSTLILGFNWGAGAYLKKIADVLNKAEFNKKLLINANETKKLILALKSIKPAKMGTLRPTKDTKMLQLGKKVYANVFKNSQLNSKAAINWLGQDNEQDSLGMVAMVVGDAGDHINFACAFVEGDSKKIEKYSDMDTASREEIPEAAWDYYLSL